MLNQNWPSNVTQKVIQLEKQPTFSKQNLRPMFLALSYYQQAWQSVLKSLSNSIQLKMIKTQQVLGHKKLQKNFL